MNKLIIMIALGIVAVSSTIYGSSFGELVANANQYAKDKVYDKALEELDEAIKQNPESARAYKVRGNIYFAMEDYAKALADFDHLVTLIPSNAEARVNRAIVYSAMGNYKEAVDEVNHALDLSPKSKFAKEARDRILRRAAKAAK